MDQSLLVATSCQANEGKSFISFELARKSGGAGRAHAVSDCDIRNSVAPGKAWRHGKTAGPVWFSLWEGTRSAIFSVGQTLPSSQFDVFCRIYFSESAELLSEELFERLCVRHRKKNYDYIIMDTAPLGLVIDAAIIAKQ